MALEVQSPSKDNELLKDGDCLRSPSLIDTDSAKPAKRQTRQWAAWTRQEEENFFNALRQVGKNFEKITCRVQSKNRDQVRHYYYRLVRRINKLLAPGFSLDAKNSKDTIAAMLRWWSLLEKFSCSASKLHLKPRRFKIFIEALENQLLKDRNKTRKRHPSQGENSSSAPSTMFLSKAAETDAHPVKLIDVDTQNAPKIKATKGASWRRSGAAITFNKEDLSTQKIVRQKRRTAGMGVSAACKRWEKAAMAGISLVADAAEQLEHTSNGRDHQQTFNMHCPGKKNISVAVDITHPPPPFLLGETCSHQIRETLVHSSGKLKLQLFPIDEYTRRALEKDSQNPHLELTLSARKRISSVLEHLNRKWGNSSIAYGELVLFPYIIQQRDIASCQKWTIEDTDASAADVYATIGSPTIFRLRYGWFPVAGHGSETIPITCDVPHLDKSIQTRANHEGFARTERREGLPDSCGQTPCVFEKEDRDDDIIEQRMRNDATFSAGQWADSLMSVGDLLSEASKAANFGSTYAAPNPEHMQSSYDSFDAAIAAQIAGQQSPGSPTRLPQSIWHAEETCDGFSFRLFPDAKREDSNPLITSSNFVLRENTCTHSLAFEDYLKDLVESSPLDEPSSKYLKVASASAEEISSDAELNELVSESAEDILPDIEKQNKIDKDPCLSDVFWPDSLGPLDLEMPSSRYQGHDMIIDESISLGGLNRLIASSLDAFQNCSFFSADRKDSPASEVQGASALLDSTPTSEE
ncbi:Polycomb-group transcriptional regulator domain-containing protein [Dioscorea alata]|uniref:Polycomb-group transcriptional regulator domain-containing protein n=1 Tax=Dioscorea alata TaxID=55571 RepID=A0ACB7UF43_DIOAL|nr:Polycomb-group transcriptional regulator domain-containing protein [Dioscorea alata]